MLDRGVVEGEQAVEVLHAILAVGLGKPGEVSAKALAGVRASVRAWGVVRPLGQRFSPANEGVLSSQLPESIKAGRYSGHKTPVRTPSWSSPL